MPKTIINRFEGIVKKYGTNTALAFLLNGQYEPISYDKLNKYRVQIAHYLNQLGCQKAEKLALMLPNSPEWVITDLAAATLGMVVVPIHTTYNEEYLKKVIQHSEAKYLVIHQEYFEKYRGVIEKLTLNHIIIVGGGEYKNNHLSQWPDFVDNDDINELSVNILEDDLHTIIYTSGTTGDPKGVMLSHKNIISNVESAKRNLPIYPEDRFFSFLPLSHAFERTAGYYTPITTGASIYFAQSTKTLVDDIKKAKPTILSSVPRIFEKIYSTIFDKVEAGSNLKKKLFYKGIQLSVLKRRGGLHFLQKLEWQILDLIVLKKIRQILGGNIRMAISGGASIGLQIIKFFDNLGLKIIEGYGMTETSPIIAVNKLDNYRFGTVGLPLDCNQVEISDSKEILVRGDNVMLGYYKNEALNTEIIDKDRWLHTGDLGFIDQEGFLTIIGRAKDVIVLSTGKNIFPEPIENALDAGRYISQSMIYGDKNKYISALIVVDVKQLEVWCKKHNVPFDLQHEKVLDFYRHKIEEKLAHFSKVEKINNFKLLKEEFSQENGLLTPTLKLKRNKIKQLYNLN